jgi:hypothetical protein
VHLNSLLREAEIDPARTIVLRNRPYEPQFDKVPPWVVSERPDLFRSYQQTHGPKLQSALKSATHMVSCIRFGPGRALFVGLFEVGPTTPLSLEEFWKDQAHIELRSFGYRGFTEDEGRDHILSFSLKPHGAFQQWQGRLGLGWPGLERSWWRWASRNEFPVLFISEEDQLAGAPPSWDAMILSWNELATLPHSWKMRLSEWRGVYLIHDTADGHNYVGSAYGATNILGRWTAYAASGHGDNKLLRGRNPATFRFSILQRVSPDMPADDVIRLEASWKLRLHTRSPFGLNSN